MEKRTHQGTYCVPPSPLADPGGGGGGNPAMAPQSPGRGIMSLPPPKAPKKLLFFFFFLESEFESIPKSELKEGCHLFET